MVTDTNMTQLGKNMENREFYLEMFNMCSNSFSANANAIFEFRPWTPQLRLVDPGYDR
jgi:hypothetical protein